MMWLLCVSYTCYVCVKIALKYEVVLMVQYVCQAHHSCNMSK
jgi:hypothetical protein